MATVVEQLISRLKSGGTFEDFLKSLVPPAAQELLKYCALVRSFDKRLVDKVFLPELSEASRAQVKFETLQELASVEPVPGVRGFYQLRENARAEYFKLWQVADGAVSPELRTLSEKLVAYYKKLGPQFDLDQLYHQIAADPAKAERQFLDLFLRADSRFDLGRCQDVLKILEARYTILSSTMLDLFKDQQARLRARGLWSREYYQTAHYYEIDSLKTAFNRIWEDRSKWILQLYARGGLGKTMFLRWLIARHCVPLSIPCARLDFDFVDEVEATQNPSILLLEIGQQLNEQIAGNYFGDALGDMKEFRPVLLKSDRPSSEREQMKTDARSRAALKDIGVRFINALNAASKSKRVVVIFDTLEEVILNEGTDLLKLLNEIKKLADGSEGNLCLLLSGRYNLEKRLPRFTTEFEGQYETLELTPWNDQDAQRYLVEKRGVTRLLTPVIKRANGNPFQLSLYADILRSDPRITASTIEKFPPGVLYLIKRIVSRIKNEQVRWLLRYGVVPRNLRLSFVQDVMGKYLPKAMSGTSKYDDPTKDLAADYKDLAPDYKKLAADYKEPAVDYEDVNPFPKIKVEKNQINYTDLWDALTQYATLNSWVSPDDEENTLSFHPEVRDPMRKMLRPHLIYGRLHRAAIRFYERKAKEQPTNTGQWIKEAVYHQFQLDPGKAAEYWRKKVNDPVIAAHPEWLQLLARDIINLAAKTDEPGTREDLVDAAHLCEAYFQVAEANIELAHINQVDPHDALWQEAAKDYRQALKIQDTLLRKIIRPARLALVQAALLRNRKKFEEAHSVLENALRRRSRAEEKIDLEIEVAESFSLQENSRQAVRHFRRAIFLASKGKLKSAQMIDIRKRLAAHYEALYEYPSAIREYKAALGSAKKVENSICSELSRRIAECYLQIGQIDQAAAHLPKALNTSAKLPQDERTRALVEALRVSLLQGRIARRRLEPLFALSAFDNVLKGIDLIRESQSSVPELGSIQAATHEQIGLVYAELLDTSKALDEIEEARRLFKDAGDDASANGCLMRMVHIQLHYARNNKAARELMDHVERLDSQAKTEASLTQDLLRIKVLDHSGRQLTAERHLRDLETVATVEKWPSRNRAAIALAKVAHKAQRGLPVSLRQSVFALKKVSPASERLVLLKQWRWVPTPHHTRSRSSASLTTVMPRLDREKPTDAIGALTVADALRVAGRDLPAAAHLNRAYLAFQKMGHTYGLIEVLRARDRLKVHRVNPAIFADDIARFVLDYTAFPHVCGAVQLEQAQRLLRFGLKDEAQRAFESAEATVKGVTLGPNYAGRFDEFKAKLSIERIWSAHNKKTKLEESELNGLKEALLMLAAAKNAYKQLDDREAVKRVQFRTKYEQKRIDSNLSRFRDPSRPNTKGPTSELQFKPADMIASPAQETGVYKLRISQSTKTGIEVSAVLPGARSRTKTVPPKYVRRVSSILHGPARDTPNTEFTNIFAEQWVSVTGEMIKVLTADTALMKVVSEDRQPINLGLEIRDPQLSGAPWEFMMVGHDFAESGLPKLSINCLYRTITDDSQAQRTITSIQLALEKLYQEKSAIDGIYGPKTKRGIERFQKENDLEPTGITDYQTIKRLGSVVARQFPRSVLIVQPSSERQFQKDRGHVSSGVNLAAEYSNLGLNPRVLEQPTPRSVANSLSEFRPQIIHLCPSIKLATNGVSLDFEGTSLPWSAVAKLLEQFGYEHKIRPLVILDVPRPSVIHEAVKQLILRNAIAASLMRITNTAAILATGLGERFLGQRLLTKSLLTSIAAGDSFTEMAKQIRNTAREYPAGVSAKVAGTPRVFSSLIGPYGTALFTPDPSGVIL